MEERAMYGDDLAKVRAVCLTPAAKWEPPNGQEIRAALSAAGWSGEEFARRVGVDGRTVRRWVLDEKKIRYAAWALLCHQAGYGVIW